MPYEHAIPAVLNPVGDACVSLFIPLDLDYHKLLLGALANLENEDYYQRDADQDDENAQVVAHNFRTRTITPLIEALAQGEACFVPQNRIHTFYSVDILTSKTRASAGFAAVGDSQILHVFTYPNVIVRAYNIGMTISTAGLSGLVRPVINGVQSLNSIDAVVHQTTARELMAVASYSSIAAGSKTVELYFANGGSGTVTVNASQDVIYEIEEWD